MALSWRSPNLSRFFTNHYGTTLIHTDVSTVLLQIKLMDPDVNKATGAKVVNV